MVRDSEAWGFLEILSASLAFRGSPCMPVPFQDSLGSSLAPGGPLLPRRQSPGQTCCSWGGPAPGSRPQNLPTQMVWVP